MNELRFNHAIVRKPCRNMVNGLTAANLGKPHYDLACEQHQNYIDALKSCGLKVDVLEADEDYPDSTFIEDVALLTPHCVIITIPGANSRKGEVDGVIETIEKHFDNIEFIQEPGTVEPGDIMMVGDHYYIGISERTNLEGARQMREILEKYQLKTTNVELKEMLHLKTGLAYLEHNNLVATGEFLFNKTFDAFNLIGVEDQESYAANCIWVNDKVIVPKGYPNTKKKIEQLGYQSIEVDVSEFRKLDGGLSCLSLRF